ncbi:MAG: YbbR-like domain-containing protein [Alloprevotella sp.]|nr:YbbR-like domain-containing protein [Alloprevotella sp.]
MVSIRELLKRLWTKQALTFLFFLVLSATFWLFTTLNDDYREEMDVDLQLVNVPENVVITTDPPSHLRISVRDKGFMILSYRYWQERKPVTIDFGSVVGRGNASGNVTIPSSELLKQVQALFGNDASVQILRPQQVEFYFNYGESKRVPLRVMGSFAPKDNASILTMLRHTPDSVTVFARPSILDTITAAYTEALFLNNLEDTTRVTVRLHRVTGVKFDPAEAELLLACDRLVEKTVTVPVQQVNFPADKKLRTFPASVNVTFQVGMGRYRSISGEDFVLVVNYEELLDRKSTRCKLSFKSLPDGVQYVRILPEEVDYVIEEAAE